ncbi:MAG: hypothetical protein Q7T23_03630, partial [Phenylobacterium sp.]|nr:hypothetical protein [Phenylobacterium sp.]
TDFPVSFSKKCIELKESLKGEAMLAHVRPTVVSVISKAKPLHAIRTIIVHGQFEGTSLKGVLTFRMSDQKRGFAGVSKRFSFDAINDASARIAALHAEMSAVTSEVWRTCAEYNAKISKAAS